MLAHCGQMPASQNRSQYLVARDFAFDGFGDASRLDAVAWKDDSYRKLVEVEAATTVVNQFKVFVHLPGMLTWQTVHWPFCRGYRSAFGTIHKTLNAQLRPRPSNSSSERNSPGDNCLDGPIACCFPAAHTHYLCQHLAFSYFTNHSETNHLDKVAFQTSKFPRTICQSSKRHSLSRIDCKLWLQAQSTWSEICHPKTEHLSSLSMANLFGCVDLVRFNQSRESKVSNLDN